MKKASKINEYNILFVFIQILLTIVCLVFVILSLFVSKNFYKFLELFMGLDLVVIGYNNYRIYKRNNITYIYAGVGLLLVVISILTFVGVI